MNNNNFSEYEPPQGRRGSARRGSRTLERSLSYSEAIRGNGSGRSSIEIPAINNTEVYTNEELKKQYRISQTYVEGKEITFPVFGHTDYDNGLSENDTQDSDSDDEDNGTNGLVMRIDVERTEDDDTSTPKYTSPSTNTVHVSNASTRQMFSPMPSEDIYESIVEESIYTTPEFTSSTQGTGRSTPYTKRKRRSAKLHRRRTGRARRSRRVVLKGGEENVPVRSNIPAKSLKYMRDIVNTIINSKWRFLLLFMVTAHFVFWFIFASIWFTVTRSYQDDIGDGKEHCVTGTSSFAGLLMMAVETQMTIGYGTRFPNEECPEAIIIMVLEIVAGTALSGGLTSLLFTKLVRPNRHVTSVGFSKKATVCLRDGRLVLQFRVWDLQQVHLVGSAVTAYMLKPIRTLEGEVVHNYIQQLPLQQARALLLWPVTVVHVIDEASPLYDLSAQNMMDYRFEIVVCLNGASASLGTVTQSRTSYLSKEIIWGYRFKNVIKYSKKNEAYIIDTENLHTVEQVETPLCSAMHLQEYERSRRLFSPESSVTQGSSIYHEGSLPSTLSKFAESLESPRFARTGTQRSYGWDYRSYPDGSEGVQSAMK
ncbi:G protein-activated inward rectifier potassium channel 3-like [Plutella xylostella]|uniref:G protein-activated inward rectifier potassium channel 3-like n=1 Tax=Plutella xylostella TaxID=51655 RepID=UPI002032A307|nr:G protein-activated inward rectifier potassium channel 3-like [Plutella xylostella]